MYHTSHTLLTRSLHMAACVTAPVCSRALHSKFVWLGRTRAGHTKLSLSLHTPSGCFFTRRALTRRLALLGLLRASPASSSGRHRNRRRGRSASGHFGSAVGVGRLPWAASSGWSLHRHNDGLLALMVSWMAALMDARRHKDETFLTCALMLPFCADCHGHGNALVLSEIKLN